MTRRQDTRCLQASIYCSQLKLGTVSIIVDGFLFTISYNSPVVVDLLCGDNGTWMAYSFLDARLHSFSNINCVFVPYIQPCAQCSFIAPSTTSNSTVSNGLSAFRYAFDDIGCKTAVMLCSSTLSNLSRQVSIIADDRSYSTGIGVASVMLTCNANRTWQINYEPQSYVFESISCQYTIDEQMSSIESFIRFTNFKRIFFGILEFLQFVV